MKTRLNQYGFSVVEAVIAVIVLAVVGFGGYVVYQSRQADNTKSSTSQQTATEDSPTVDSAADLDKVDATLDQTDPDGSNTNDLEQLDSQLDEF